MNQDEPTIIDAGDNSNHDGFAARPSPFLAARKSPPRRSSLRDLLLNDDNESPSSAKDDAVDYDHGHDRDAFKTTSPAQSNTEQRHQQQTPTENDASVPQGSSLANEDDGVKDDESHQFSASSSSFKIVGTSYSGGKMQHLKKEDGLPLWRADIQYDLLNTIFSDDSEVFTPLPPPKESQHGDTTRTPATQGKLRFADLYIDAISRSEKTSKTLRHQLMTEKTSAINIAMVCLLVNLGRMNTTLCFSPEMKAHLRTYHSIPCLQANVDDYEDHMYKQLQDAPRLKSILKRAADQDPNQIFTLEDMRKFAPPRLSPISLIFLLSQYAPKISELHFTPPTDFYDLILRSNLSSKTRAHAFLWLMWFYLESDFSEEAARNNPFGACEIVEHKGERLFRIPPLAPLTDEEIMMENVDTNDEVVYGKFMQDQRKDILSAESHETSRPTNRRGGKSVHLEGMYPARHADQHAPEHRVDGPPSSERLLTSEGDTDQPNAQRDITLINPGRSRISRRGTQAVIDANNNTQLAARINLKTINNSDLAADPNAKDIVIPASDASPFMRTPVADSRFEMRTSATGGGTRRSRPMTQHQLALAQSRAQRIDHVLSLKRADKIKEMRDLRKEAEANTSVVMRAKHLLARLPEDYDTDNDDEVVINSHTVAVPNSNAAVNQNAISGVKIQSHYRKSWGPGGLCANPEIEEDYGELAQFYSSVLRKVGRRLNRWDWDAILHTATHPEPSPEPAPLPQPSLHGLVSEALPTVSRRGGRRRGIKRAAPNGPLAQDNFNGHREKRPRAGARAKASDGPGRRGGRPSAAATAQSIKPDEGEINNQPSVVPARLHDNITHADSSDVEMNNMSQFGDGDRMDEIAESESGQQPEDVPDESMVGDMDTTLGNFEPDQYPRSDYGFAGPKPIPKSIDRLRPQSHHPYHHHDLDQYGNTEDLDSEASSIAFPENDLLTSDIDGSAADGDEVTSIVEGNDADDDDHVDGSYVSNGEVADQTLYSDDP